jgi:hypothetical protein
MSSLGIGLLVQVCLMFGVAGLLWPEKFMPVFAVLMFPWYASHKSLRMNSIAAIALSVLLFLGLIVKP